MIFPQYDVITDPLTAIFIGSARFSPLGFPSIAALSFPEMQWADNSNVSPSSKPGSLQGEATWSTSFIARRGSYFVDKLS